MRGIDGLNALHNRPDESSLSVCVVCSVIVSVTDHTQRCVESVKVDVRCCVY